MTNIETTLTRVLTGINMRYPVFFDSSAFQYPCETINEKPILDILTARTYEGGIENLLAVPAERIRKEIEVIEDIDRGISNNNPAFIPEVIKEVSTYRNNMAGYNKFCKNACRNARFERRSAETKNLKEKSMLVRWLVDELNEICPKMYGHNPHVCFEDEEKMMYERLLELSLPEMERRDRLRTLRYGEKPMSLGKTLKTDSKIIAAALTLSCTIPTYILTRDIPLLETAELIRSRIKEQEVEANMPMLHKSDLHVINLAAEIPLVELSRRT